MYVLRRHLVLIGLFLAALLPARSALAWVETSTESHAVTLTVERDGSATVSHEIMMRVKGGPLTSIELEGVDSDATVLPDATVASAEGKAGAESIPLLLEKRDDGTLRAEIDHAKGVRRGRFLFKLAYRTRLSQRDMIREKGSMVEVRWVAPRPPHGIDSARVVFRLPPGPVAPRLADSDDDPGGIFLANLRRAPDKDELEIVRPHVAKGEPVVWRVLASPKSFDAFGPAETNEPSALPQAQAEEDPERRLYGIALLALVLVGYSSLVYGKWRVLTRAAMLKNAVPRALVPIPAVLRAALAGAFLAGAVAVAALTDHPTAAGALLLVAILLASHVGPKTLAVPRRPGRWLPLSDEDAFSRREPKLPGRWLDAGTPVGFALFLTSMLAIACGAAFTFFRSPYHGIELALASTALLPIFCTGRGGELPPDAASRPSALLAWLAKRLRENPQLKVVAWARVPEGGSDPDELRLLVLPRRALPGLGGIEFGVEYQAGLGGNVALPWVMVRAAEASLAQHALPRNVVWSRGRKPEERAAVLRPKLPTRALSLGLLRSVAQSLVDRGESRPKTRQPAIKLAMSGGKGSSMAKPAMVSSPAQAM